MTNDPRQQDAFGRIGVGATRDRLDRHFTPLPLARVVLRWFRDLNPDVEVKRFVEPSAGGGAMLIAARELWPSAHLIAVDADPRAEARHIADEFILGDWLVEGYSLRDVDLIAGNPPFTGKTGIHHVEACLECDGGKPPVVLILPWAPLGGVARWDPFMVGERAPSHAGTIQPRPWGANVRETAAYVWTRRNPRGTLVQRLPRWKR